MCTVPAGQALGGAGPNAVLCKTCSVFLSVLEQLRVDNSSTVPLKSWTQLEAVGRIDLKAVPHVPVYVILIGDLTI